MITQHDQVAEDGTMLPTELAALLTALRARFFQREIPEDLFEELSRDTSGELMKYPLAFPNERRFPVFMISLVGPQHGHMFHAFMEKDTLTIMQSKLYSFEKKNTAYFNLFTLWYLGTPQ
ncbi:hypothetical protein BDV59DRAFT_200594 [Aspergillus ambiguus]|uniref:uncharacterized protein n=1 Tax=Aspergillus ambiguus TaxID=176160 RepID=UPI003CCD0C88